jgi:3-methyladenine DNA glycosylase Tag
MKKKGFHFVFHDYSIEQLMEKITEQVQELRDDNARLRKRLKEYDQAEEIKSRDAEINSLHERSLMMLSEKERNAQKAFRERHYASCKNGGHYVYDLVARELERLFPLSVQCAARKKISQTMIAGN